MRGSVRARCVCQPARECVCTRVRSLRVPGRAPAGESRPLPSLRPPLPAPRRPRWLPPSFHLAHPLLPALSPALPPARLRLPDSALFSPAALGIAGRHRPARTRWPPQCLGTCWRRTDRCWGLGCRGREGEGERVCVSLCVPPGGVRLSGGCNSWLRWRSDLRRKHLRWGSPPWASGDGGPASRQTLRLNEGTVGSENLRGG